MSRYVDRASIRTVIRDRYEGSHYITARDALVEYDNRLHEAGAFTPDRPAAPDEDAAVRELAEVIAGYGNEYPASWCMGEAKHIHKAGYTRRPVDTRPTRSDLWDIGGFDDGGNRWPIDHNGIDALINAGYAREDDPDPAPAAEVPVFASVEDCIAYLDDELPGWGIARYERGVWSTWGRKDHIGFNYKGATEIEALQALAAALTKATDR